MCKKFCLTAIFLVFLSPLMAHADSVIVGAIKFVPLNASQDFYRDIAVLYNYAGSSGGIFLAPVDLPDGVRITSVVLFYRDNSSSENISVMLQKRNLYSNDTIFMAGWDSSGSSSGVQTHKISPIAGGSIVNNSGYAYAIRLNLSDLSVTNAMSVYGVKINYQ
jgi:hypothetical protein